MSQMMGNKDMRWIYPSSRMYTIGKFITWRGNYALNCMPKPISVFKFYLTQNSRVRWWIFLESHNWIRSWKKGRKTAIILFGFYPEHAFQKAISKSTVKTVILSANKKQGQSCTVKVKANFALKSCQQYHFMHKCNSTLNTIANWPRV